ncbi:hypothetical protein OF83DRAFT_146952 [Amylostereum chailletii]|nr:hypothetical protein OF83DRAFT_146952 [Amylostereum chailletii]
MMAESNTPNNVTTTSTRTTLSRHGPILSSRSRDKEFDIFIFWSTSRYATLVGAINSTLNDPGISVKQVKAWLRILQPDLKRLPGFRIYPAAVTRLPPGSCTVEPKEKADPIPSENIILPGSYCCIVEGATSYRNPLVPYLRNRGSFTVLKRTLERRPERNSHNLSFYNLPEYIQEVVHGNQCFLTGRTSSTSLSIHWLFPPIWATKLPADTVPYLPAEHFIVPNNAAMMNERVAKLMHDNAFGIDVSEGYRFVAFDKDVSGLKDELRPEILSALGQKDPSLTEFLHYHFLWCLLAHFIGEDMKDEFPVGEISALYRCIELHEVDSHELATLKQKPVWQTPAGMEVWDSILANYYGDGASEEEDDSDTTNEEDSDSDSERFGKGGQAVVVECSLRIVLLSGCEFTNSFNLQTVANYRCPFSRVPRPSIALQLRRPPILCPPPYQD